MSNDRVIADVKRDHIHIMNTLFRWNEITQKWDPQPEVFFNTPNIAVDMGNFIGALNKAEHEQYPGGSKPVVVLAEFKRGDSRMTFDAYPDKIMAIPFQLGPGPFTNPAGYASSAEMPVPGQQPAMRYAALSRTPGDMSNPTVPGKQVTIDFTAAELGEGLWYFNTYLAPEYGVTSSSFSVAFPH